MNRTDHVIKSKKLGKDINVRVYGTKGYPVIAFPTQDQMADEWEANGMTDVFAPYVDDGRVQLFTVDSNDLESWSNPSDDYAARIARQEDYYNFVCDELVPFVHKANGSQLRPELTGASLGATQATICALRRPDLFQGVIALSGMYHTSYFFGDWGNDVSYANDVNAFLPNTPADHPYLPLYRQRTFAFSIGQAPDEQFGVDDLHFLQQTFDKLGISGWFDFWGPECNHDWFWWKQQMAKFLPEAVKELEGVAAAEPDLAKPAEEPTKKAEPVEKAARRTAAVKAEPAKRATKAEEKKPAASKAAAKPAAKAEAKKAATQADKPAETKTGAAKKAEAAKPAAAPKAKASKTVSATKAEPAKKAAKPATKTTASKAAAATTKAAPAKKASTGAAKAPAAKAASKAKAPKTTAKPAAKASKPASHSTRTSSARAHKATTKKSAK